MVEATSVPSHVNLAITERYELIKNIRKDAVFETWLGLRRNDKIEVRVSIINVMELDIQEVQ